MQTVDQAIENLKDAINQEMKSRARAQFVAAFGDEGTKPRKARTSKANGQAKKTNGKTGARSEETATRFEAITDYVKKHAGCKATAIAESLGLDVKQISSDLSRLKSKEIVASEGKTRSTTWSVV